MSSSAHTFNAAYINHAPAATFVETWGILYPHVLLKIGEAALDPDMYENGKIDGPEFKAIVKASNILGSVVPEKYLAKMEIDPYLGDINATWRNRQTGKRVKVTFVKNSDTILLYYESIQNGKVVDSDLIEATKQKITARLDWLHS